MPRLSSRALNGASFLYSGRGKMYRKNVLISSHAIKPRTVGVVRVPLFDILFLVVLHSALFLYLFCLFCSLLCTCT